MKVAPSRTASRVAAGLLPLALIAGLIPLLAPTCGTFEEGVKTFSRNSLIIPMDVCYQCSTDGDSGTSPSTCGQTSYVTPTGTPYLGGQACPQATDAGDVVKAYGLVYQLIRNGVAVYWIIEPSKMKLDAEDFSIEYGAGPPAFLYDWATGNPGASVTSQSTVVYRGGPFVVDGSDYAKASLILQQYRATFGTDGTNPTRYAVNVHVANVAFQAPVKRTMAGGWNAGGTIAPKLALLDIGSTGSGAGTKNSEVVIRGYLIKAGLDVVGAGGTSAAGQHGQIYDRLTMADFLTTGGDWTTSKLYQNGYQILWVPHWLAPGSCSDCTTSASTGSGTCPTTTCPCSVRYSAANIADALKTIGAFYGSGRDVFAECAGLGSFEGVLTGSYPDTTVNTSYGAGDASTHFQTVATGSPATTGVWINKSVSSTATFQGGYASPFMQIGDFVFRPYSGAIQNYRPTTHNPTVSRYLSETNDVTYDIFTMVPAVINDPPQAGDHGTSVYLGGHSYSGCDGTFQTAGSRLVLNSLFNLGASCVSSGVSCSTGQLGVCARGAMTCSGGTTVCERLQGPSPEACNGVDDDCNGLVDDLPVDNCYDDPNGGTENVGLCRGGVRSCMRLSDGSYGPSACQGQVLPTTEVCNGLDDDCDGSTDEGLTQGCYLGPSSSLDPATGLPMGECRTGTQSCSGGNWGPCAGQVTPIAEDCGGDGQGNGKDDNCNGQIDETCGCVESAIQPCYGGPAGTSGNLPCKSGNQTCSANTWGPCVGQVVPVAEICGNGIDDDCNGTTDDATICSVCPTPPQSCYTGPAGTLGVGVCAAGERVCTLGVFGSCGGVSGATVFDPQILPSQEVCDGVDNDCDGDVDGLGDEGPPACGTGFECVNGYCVDSFCNPESVLPGYTCDAATSRYVLAPCGTEPAAPECAPGRQCQLCDVGAACPLGGICVDPCESITCGVGSVCGGGRCSGGSCYSEGCGSGLVCKNGNCVADQCDGIYCPSGTFCREGDCVQSCTFISCAAGQRCGVDGFCEVDRCSGVSCTTTRICSPAIGSCVENACRSVSCGAGQYCDAGICVDDPCANIDCPVGVCYRGQCFSSANPFGVGTLPTRTDDGGCGCSSGAPPPVALLLGLLVIPLARRRREARRGPGLLALVLAAGLAGTLAGCPGPKEETAGPIDLMTDASNCGQAGNVCASGWICVDGFCGPGSAVAPWISSISPPSAAKGTTAPVAVTLTGQRFESGAELRLITPTETIEVPTGFVDAQHLTANLDLSTAPLAILYLRVRNPDLVRSNAAPFDIVLETPVVSSVCTDDPIPVCPPMAQAGDVKTLHATGTGLNATSQCHISSTTFADTGLPSAVAGGGLDCTLDTAGVPPGNYTLWIQNEGNLKSRTFALGVTSSSTMALTSLSPSSAKGDGIIGLTVYGTGLDATCRVYFDSAAQSTTYFDPTTVYVAQLDLTLFTGADHLVSVRCGSATSNTLDFTINASAPQLTLVSPQTAYQGETGKVITFDGTSLPNGVGLAAQIRKLDGTWVDFGATSWTSATRVTGTLGLTPATSWPDGEYQVRLKFPDTSTSVTFPFRVLSNAASLRSISPAGGAQGTSITTLSALGTNFFSGIEFHLLGPGGIDVILPVNASPAMTSTTAALGPLSLANRDTGLYQIVARNVGSGDSNALSFSITPGPPTIVGRSPTSATQGDTPVPVTITGTNFAKPDAYGNGGSQVVAWNTNLGITEAMAVVIPSGAVQVVDYDTIVVTLDTRSVLASATYPYTIQVWNAGVPLQKSPVTANTTFTVLP